jgi:hypothetical protein
VFLGKVHVLSQHQHIDHRVPLDCPRSCSPRAPAASSPIPPPAPSDPPWTGRPTRHQPAPSPVWCNVQRASISHQPAPSAGASSCGGWGWGGGAMAAFWGFDLVANLGFGTPTHSHAFAFPRTPTHSHALPHIPTHSHAFPRTLTPTDQLRDQRSQGPRYWPPFAPWVQGGAGMGR